MSEHITHAEYRSAVDTTFRIEGGGISIPLRLAEVTQPRYGGGFEQFSLLFNGPADQRLPQGTYELHHDVLGTMQLFIVPVLGSNAERMVYEAVFSRPMQPPSP